MRTDFYRLAVQRALLVDTQLFAYSPSLDRDDLIESMPIEWDTKMIHRYVHLQIDSLLRRKEKILRRALMHHHPTYNTVQSSATETRNSTDHRSTSVCSVMRSLKRWNSSRFQYQHSFPHDVELERRKSCFQRSRRCVQHGDKNNLSLFEMLSSSNQTQLSMHGFIEHFSSHD